MRFSVLLTSKLKSALGFVSNRLKTNTGVDITNAGFQLSDAFLVCLDLVEQRSLGIQRSIKIFQSRDTGFLYPSENPSLPLQVNYSTFLPGVLIPIKAIFLPRIKIGADDLFQVRMVHFHVRTAVFRLVFPCVVC